MFFKDVSVLMEIPKPMHKGLIIVGTKTVPVFQNKNTLDGGAYLLRRRQHGIRKDVSFYPSVGPGNGTVSTDGMQQKKPVILQTIPD